MDIKVDKVTILSFIICAISFLFLDFLSIKKSRISEGIGTFRLAELPEIWVLIIIGLVLLLILSTAFMKGTWLKYVAGVLTGALVVTIIALAGINADRIVHGDLSIDRFNIEEYPYIRVALDKGFWLFLLGLIINIINTMKYLKSRITWKLILIGLTITGIVVVFATGMLSNLSIMKEFHNKQDIFLNEFFTHIILSFISISISTVIGVSLGIAIYKVSLVKKVMFPVLNISQTIPSIALFGIMVALLPLMGLPGIGWLPAIIALVIYALLPITRNTYTAFTSIDNSIIEAGRGMGMSGFQVMYKILFPLSIPIILNGIRIALVQIIGLTAIVTLIGAGGLGKFVFSGADSTAYDLILLGAIPIIIIAVIADYLMQLFIQITRPKGFNK
jgi:osmoprotectant transport system permease protein